MCSARCVPGRGFRQISYNDSKSIQMLCLGVGHRWSQADVDLNLPVVHIALLRKCGSTVMQHKSERENSASEVSTKITAAADLQSRDLAPDVMWV